MTRERSGTTRPPVPPEADTFVFDLDDTLYPRSAGLHGRMVDRVITFIAELTGASREAAAELHAQYYRAYGTSLVGLQRHHGVSPRDFMRFVHAVDLAPIAPCPRLAAALAALPGRRIVFTNGSVAHARRVLAHLEMAGLFEAIFDIEACGFVGKPARSAYEAFLAHHAVDPRRAVMFDDRPENLLVPHDLGMRTVLVGDGSVASLAVPHVHAHTSDLARFLAARSGAHPALRQGPASPLVSQAEGAY